MKHFIKELKAYYANKEEINLHEPLLDNIDADYVSSAIKSGFVSSIGKFVDDFEKTLCEYSNAKHCVASVNGTSALHLTLVALGVQSDDLVITQSLTFVATVNAIFYTGANPIFIDVNPTNYGMCPTALKEFISLKCTVTQKGCFHISSGKQIKAVIPMHTFGVPCSIDEIKSICDEAKIFLIEDAAEALGSKVNGKMCGTFGTAGIYSFNGNKLITTGGGGAVVTSNEELSSKIRHLATTGKIKHPFEFLHDSVAFNYRMPNLNAALGYSQLKKIPRLLASKSRLLEFYRHMILKYNLNMKLQTLENGVVSNNWLISAEFPKKLDRDKFVKEMIKNKINVRIPWRPIHLLPMYQKNEHGDLNNTLNIYQTVVNLPSSPWGHQDGAK